MADKLVLERRLTANQVAELIGVHVETIYKWCRLGKIPCIKLGRHRLRFRHSDIESWLAKQTIGKF